MVVFRRWLPSAIGSLLRTAAAVEIMQRAVKRIAAIIVAGVMTLSNCAGEKTGEDGGWGAVQRIEFGQDELPQNLYSMFTGSEANSVLQYCLPVGYSPAKTYPLILYVPGFHGHPGGNIGNAIDIANGRECVVASLPLFKVAIDQSEPAGGVIVSFSDFPALSDAWRVMLGRLFETVPNIDRSKSAMVGFSNGAITIGVLVSMHDEFILDRFHSFCLVDHGMFHLTDLHKSKSRDRRFLILVGDQPDMGRELKLRGAKLWEECYRLLGFDVESRVLPNTGHELTATCKKDIGAWIFADGDSP